MKGIVGVFGLAALTVFIVVGCAGQKNPLLLPNQPPEVELFAQRVEGLGAGPASYRLRWTGHDPDGAVDHFLFSMGSPAENPRTAAWTATTAREHLLRFPGRASLPARASIEPVEPTVFSVRAVDGTGAKSEPGRVAFFESAQAPVVEIRVPPPNALIRYSVGSGLCVRWEGFAFPDSTGEAGQVVEYKHFLLTPTTEVPVSVARVFPDSVRRYYAPRGWPGWTSEEGDVTSAMIEGLTADTDYAFVITCFDAVGNYDPLFNFNKNMIYMRSQPAGAALPRITVSNEFFLHTEPVGTYDPTRVINVDVPADQKITFNWYADPPRDSRGNIIGGPILGYRWGLDLRDVTDDQHGDDGGHSRHWTRWSVLSTSATIGPFRGGETHHFYVEASNDPCGVDAGRPALVSLRLNVVQPSFDKDLLIVDDTRYMLDRIQLGTLCTAFTNRPVGNWPTQAELDTFLYARGGVPWKCYPTVGGQPQLSSPGIFDGYRFDTLGTNLRVADLTIPLATLSQYRHVIWLTDGAAALNSRPGTDAGDIGGPMTSMRYMNDVGRQNTLAAYVAQGGKVWLAGGGAATASMINFNRTINDNSLPIPRTLTFRFMDNELIPGRFMYDQAHWRSEFKQFRVNNGRLLRHLGRLESNPGVYGSLLPEIRLKTQATDPYPPNRAFIAGTFYQTQFDIEFLSGPNEIVEDTDPRPPHENFESALDSVFKATASSLQPDVGPGAVQSVTMTVYHGQDNAQFIMTGFNIWNFRRSDCVALVDFVLQQMWGLTRGVPAPAAIEAGSADAPQPVGRLAKPREGRASAGAAREARRN